jgi:hypothetical protein
MMRRTLVIMVLGMSASLFGIVGVHPADAAQVDCAPSLGCIWEQANFHGDLKAAWDDSIGACEVAPGLGARSAYNHTSPKPQQPEVATLGVFEGTGCQTNLAQPHVAWLRPGQSAPEVGFVIRSFCLVTRNTDRCRPT